MVHALQRKGAHSINIHYRKEVKIKISIFDCKSSDYARNTCGLRHQMADPTVETSQKWLSGPNISLLNQCYC